MKQGPSRFRRMATACVAGMAGLSVISVLGLASPAGAAVVPFAGSYIHAPTAPNIAPTTTNSPAGDLQINFAAGTTWTTGSTIPITVLDSASVASINFAGAPVAAVTNAGSGNQALCAGTGCTIGIAANVMTITLTGLTSQAAGSATPEQLTVSGIGYTTSSANTGAVLITSPGFTTGPGASNAVVATPPGISLYAASTPLIPPGATTAAGAWALFLTGNNSTWAIGDKIYIAVARHDRTNCETAGRPDSVSFAGTPLVFVNAISGGATATPTVTASFMAGALSSCASFSGVNNVMVLTFTNAGSITTGSTNPIQITIAGLSYTVSADVGDIAASNTLPNTNNLGTVRIASSYNTLPTWGQTTFGVPNDKLQGGSITGAPFGPSNADININILTIVSNKPNTNIQFNVTSSGGEVVNQPVSPITITEGNPGALQGGVVGWACIALSPNSSPGNAAEFATLPTVTATGGGIAIGNVSLLTPGGFTGPSELAFQVTTASSGTPGTVTVSGISLNVPMTFTSALNAELASGANSASDACATANTGSGPSGTLYRNPVTGQPYFPVASIIGRIWGQVQDATAAQVFEFNPPTCHNNLTPKTTPAVLVTNGSYQDALSASYLAGQLNTGILTTNTNSVSPEALRALALTGVTQVFVVGGPLVVSPADITQLENTPAYTCNGLGTVPRVNALGQIIDLTVQRIYGQTADDTAGAVGTFSGAGPPGTGNFQAAYGGAYNDTSGSSGSPVSSAPDVPVTTAILATDQSFTDAASASAVAYTNHFPLLLTGQDTLSPAAATALANDSVQQVLVMGGPIAISDNVVTQVEAMGITVLRIAGQDFTDTSQLLARFELASTNLAGQANGLDYDPFYLSVARGDYYTDAIVVSRMSVGVPILLTWDPNSTSQPGGTDYLGTFLTAAGQGLGLDPLAQDGTINNLLIVGGTFAISNPLAITLGHDLNG